MKVNRIISNIKASNLEKAKAFYKGIFELELVMDHGWIQTYTAKSEMNVQLSIASEGGSGTPVDTSEGYK